MRYKIFIETKTIPIKSFGRDSSIRAFFVKAKPETAASVLNYLLDLAVKSGFVSFVDENNEAFAFPIDVIISIHVAKSEGE